MLSIWTKTLAALLLVTVSWSAASDVTDKVPGDATEQKIAALIKQLGDPAYPTRQRAQEELIKLGYEAFDALVEAQASDDPEVAMQANYLVRLVRVGWTREGDPKPVQQVLKDYEAQSDERRAACIKQLAELPGGLGLPWLCRMVRFERSTVLAKQAALAIIDQQNLDEAALAERAKVVHQALDKARRPAARWVTTWLDTQNDPASGLKSWTELVDAERQALDHHPQDSSSQIVVEMLRRKVELIERLDRTGDVDAVLRQMVQVERGDPASLGELIEWLARRKAWNMVDEISTRFSASLEGDALLLYTLCEARRAQGDSARVEQTAEKALKLSETALDHYAVAERLMERGLTEWSDRELRYIITQGPVASPVALRARILLSDSLHDRLLEMDAAEVLRGLVEAMDSEPTVAQQVNQLLKPSDKEPRWLRAKMYYYLAGHAAAQKDTAEQRKFLDQAFQHDPEELDVLIALYRLGDDDPARRAALIKQIRTVVDACRSAIDDGPDDVSSYNELAWLVANTEGDFDEALRISQKSVEMVRASTITTGDFRRVGQFLDTLGHCYFAKKDYANAVKCQTEAARLDPYSKAIGRQLKVFREALDAQQGDRKPTT
jgi:tetratricopeptide (TPR) repeat protein